MEKKKTWSNIVASKDSSFPTPPSHSPSPPLLSAKMENFTKEPMIDKKVQNGLTSSWPVTKQSLLEERSPLSIPPGLDSDSNQSWRQSRLKTVETVHITETASQGGKVSSQAVVGAHWDWNFNQKPFWSSHAEPTPDIARPKSGLGLSHLDSTSLPTGRQNRSLSLSLGQPLKLEETHGDAFKSKLVTAPVLSALDSLEEDAVYELGKNRSRSKSFSAFYALGAAEEEEEYQQIKNVISPNHQDIWNIEEEMALSNSSSSSLNANNAQLYHRRASTQPNGGLLWETRHPFDPVVENGQIMLNQEQLEKFKQQRRFSHAPTLYKEFSSRLAINRAPGAPPSREALYESSSVRRHSMATTVPQDKSVLEGQVLENKPAVLSEINDYFENTENRARARAEAGRNLLNSNLHKVHGIELDGSLNNENASPSGTNIPWPLYVVEFKAGRTDFFFVPQDVKRVKKGDIVIVEADRGKDLGKVIEDNIQSMPVLQKYQAMQMELLPEAHGNLKSVIPKRIYRLAESSEVTLLFSKNQDEAKAMSICQAKVKQRNLPMEIVDAEYQW